MKNSFLVLNLASLLLLAACSASGPAKKSEGVLDFTVTPESTVAGPNVQGDWASDCIRNPLSYDLKRKIRLTVKGAGFQQQQTNYSDSDCSQISSTEKSVQGTLTFTKDYGNSTYLGKYFIPLTGGTSTWEYRNFSLNVDVLKITDARTWPEDLVNVAPNIELRKVNSAPPAPPAQQPPASGGGLSSGYYVTDASMNLCDASVSTMSSGGQVLQVYLNLSSPCNNGTLTFDCQGNVCAISGSDSLRITLLEKTSFELYVKSSGKRAIYKKQ